MWQPEQPSSQQVPILTLPIAALPAHQRPSRIALRPAHDGALLAPSPRRPSPSRPARRSGRPARTCRSWCRCRLAPGSLQLGDEPRADAAAGDVPDVGALDLGAGAHAARAEDAAVVVEHVARVRGVDREPRVVVRIADVVTPCSCGQGLQLAVAGGHADRADVVALDEQQLQRDLAVGLQLLRRSWSPPGPPRTGVVQAGSRRDEPATSTMQSRQAPTGVRPSM